MIADGVVSLFWPPMHLRGAAQMLWIAALAVTLLRDRAAWQPATQVETR
jgi:hypothetical protein